MVVFVDGLRGSMLLFLSRIIEWLVVLWVVLIVLGCSIWCFDLVGVYGE